MNRELNAWCQITPRSSWIGDWLIEESIKRPATNTLKEDKKPVKKPLAPTKIIHSGPCTIVFWNDDTKTIVRCSDNDTYDQYAAFCAALAKKMFNTNSHLKKLIRSAQK